MKRLKIVSIIALIIIIFGNHNIKAQGEFIEYNHNILSSDKLLTPNEVINWDPIQLFIDADIPFLNIVVEINESANLDILEDVFIRFSNNGVAWSEYQQVKKDPHADDIYELTRSDLIYADANTNYIQLKAKNSQLNNINISDISLLISAPSNDGSIRSYTNSTYRDGCELPDFQSRTDWCSSGECPIGGGVETDVTHLIVHHSAGTNASSNWPAVVRSIWHYHVDTRGWDDIGYNWLIDANGVLYQGRLDDIRGAHMCGHNTGTMGICVLGNFQNDDPTDDALATLYGLLAWKSNQKSLDPLATTYHASSGKNLKTISGHKDGCSPGYTECPGNQFHPELPNVRNEVNELYSPCQTGVNQDNIIEIKLKNSLVSNTLDIDGVDRIYNYYIHDAVGNQLLHANNTFLQSIDVTLLTNGIYLLSLEQDGNINISRFVVMR